MNRSLLAIALVAVLLAMPTEAKTTKAETAKRDRVTENYHKCVERVKRNFNPKTDDGIALIVQCRDWAIMNTD